MHHCMDCHSSKFLRLVNAILLLSFLPSSDLWWLKLVGAASLLSCRCPRVWTTDCSMAGSYTKADPSKWCWHSFAWRDGWKCPLLTAQTHAAQCFGSLTCLENLKKNVSSPLSPCLYYLLVYVVGFKIRRTSTCICLFVLILCNH